MNVKWEAGNELDIICTTCCEGFPENECPKSRRECGHHCNCSWEQDECCWCGATFGIEKSEVNNG